MKNGLQVIVSHFCCAQDEERDKLLREILTDVGGIKQTTARKDFTAEQKISLETIKGTIGKALRDFNDTKYGEIKTSIDGVKQSVDDIKTAKQESTVNHYHRHTVDDVVGRVLGTLVGLTVALLISIIVIAVQWRENGKLRDNDLKYRFIQMANGADPEMIMKLRDAFEFHRDKEIIRNVRRQVEEYERLVKQEAETAAKARFNASEAERLRNEAETVRGGKK
jgi:tetrahydromethanopterin S-methyltransferase subunit G